MLRASARTPTSCCTAPLASSAAPSSVLTCLHLSGHTSVSSAAGLPADVWEPLRPGRPVTLGWEHYTCQNLVLRFDAHRHAPATRARSFCSFRPQHIHETLNIRKKRNVHQASPSNRRAEVDGYLANRGPALWLGGLRGRLLLPPGDAALAGTHYDVPLLNSLVFYVGIRVRLP